MGEMNFHLGEQSREESAFQAHGSGTVHIKWYSAIRKEHAGAALPALLI